MTEGQVAGQAKQDVEADGKDPEDHETLHQVRVTGVELRKTRAFGEGVEDEGGQQHEGRDDDQQFAVVFF